jgi:hypothetical protein
LLLGVLALVHLAQVHFRKAEKEKPLLDEVRWKRGAWVAAALLLYALLLPRLGYLLTTFLLMGVLFSVYERRKWWVVGSASLLVIILTYLVFHHWLKVQFPVGFFRIG